MLIQTSTGEVRCLECRRVWDKDEGFCHGDLCPHCDKKKEGDKHARWDKDEG